MGVGKHTCLTLLTCPPRLSRLQPGPHLCFNLFGAENLRHSARPRLTSPSAQAAAVNGPAPEAASDMSPHLHTVQWPWGNLVSFCPNWELLLCVILRNLKPKYSFRTISCRFCFSFNLLVARSPSDASSLSAHSWPCSCCHCACSSPGPAPLWLPPKADGHRPQSQSQPSHWLTVPAIQSRG